MSRKEPMRPSEDVRAGRETEVVDLHEPIYREMAEPKDGFEPTPLWLVFFIMVVVGFGGWYIGKYSGGWNPMVYDEMSGNISTGPAADEGGGEIDPMVLGRRVYGNCAACHQADGSGVPGAYPPLAGSDWVTGPPGLAAAIVLHGLEGPITVAGETYDGSMPGWAQLSDQQIAAVLTYVRASFGNQAPPVAPELVAAVRERVADLARPLRVPILEELRPELPLAAAAEEPAAAAGDAEADGGGEDAPQEGAPGG